MPTTMPVLLLLLPLLVTAAGGGGGGGGASASAYSTHSMNQPYLSTPQMLAAHVLMCNGQHSGVGQCLRLMMHLRGVTCVRHISIGSPSPPYCICKEAAQDMTYNAGCELVATAHPQKRQQTSQQMRLKLKGARVAGCMCHCRDYQADGALLS